MTSWYGNGLEKYEENYKDGKQDGKWTSWHENGQKKLEGKFKDGKEDGLLTEWDENGQITVSNWKDGECISGDC